MKKRIVFLTTIASFMMLFNACGKQVQPQSEFETKTREIYALYVADGGDLSYEDWLKSIAGADGKDGKDGKSAYEIYKDTHPEYAGTEDQWLDDLINGRLGNKEMHTVTFDSHGGYDIPSQQVLHGEKALKPSDPVRNGYTFTGWTYKGEQWEFVGYVVTENMTLDANWVINEYTAIFKNNDGTILETQTNLHYGDKVIYGGETPAASNQEDHYVYTFTGWDKELTVIDDMVFIAQYSKEYAPYTVKYLDEDDNLLYQVFVKEGESSKYIGDEPTKDSTDELQYAFSGWEEISKENNIITYKPQYDSCTNGIEFSGSKVEIYHGSSKNIVIPEQWKGLKITGIGRNSFSTFNIETVQLPDTIQYIEDAAFYSCKHLTTINLPNSLRKVGTQAFSGCENLVNISLNEGLTEIGYHAFDRCGIKRIVIPSTVVHIFDHGFYGVKADFIYIPSSVTKIDWNAFTSTEGYTNTIYCQREYRPSTYDADWAVNSIVVWGYELTE